MAASQRPQQPSHVALDGLAWERCNSVGIADRVQLPPSKFYRPNTRLLSLRLRTQQQYMLTAVLHDPNQRQL